MAENWMTCRWFVSVFQPAEAPLTIMVSFSCIFVGLNVIFYFL